MAHFPEEELLKLMRDMGKALACTCEESQRLVHRDVKPDNILVNDEEVNKLADLGHLRLRSPRTARRIQERIFGSPHYVAPEQAKGGAIDGRADLYELARLPGTSPPESRSSTAPVAKSLRRISMSPFPISTLQSWRRNSVRDMVEIIESLA